MTRPNSTNMLQDFSFDQQGEDLEFLKNLEEFAAGFTKDDFNISKEGVSPQAAQILEKMPERLKEYLVEIKKLAQEKKSEKKGDEITPESEKKRLENQERAEKIAQEIFIVSCASNKGLGASMEFHRKCKMGVKELSDFGENGLSPMAAVAISGRDEDAINQDMANLMEKGADINARSASGMTVMDVAMMVGNDKVSGFLREKGGKMSFFASENGQAGNDFDRNSKEEFDRRFNRSGPQEEIQDAAEIERLQKESEETARREAEQTAIENSQKAIEMHEEFLAKEAAKSAKKARLKDEEIELQESNEEESAKEAAQELESSSQEVLSPEEEAVKDSISESLGIKPGSKTVNQMLFIAASNGDLGSARSLMSIGGDVNYREGNVSVLSAAVATGDSTLTSILFVGTTGKTRDDAAFDCRNNVQMSSMLKDISTSSTNRSYEEQQNSSLGQDPTGVADLWVNRVGKNSNYVQSKESFAPPLPPTSHLPEPSASTNAYAVQKLSAMNQEQGRY